MIGKIAVSAANFAIDKPYSYRIPEGLSVVPGSRVTVPFGRGNRRCEGIVLSVEDGETEGLKDIHDVMDADPLLTETQLRLAAFMRERYFCTFYDAIRVMLPAALWFRRQGTVSLCDGARIEEAEESVKSLLTFLRDLGGSASEDALKKAFSAEEDFQSALEKAVKRRFVSRNVDIERKNSDKTERIATLLVFGEELKAFLATRGRSAAMQKAALEFLSTVGTASVKDIGYFTGASPDTLKRLEKLGLLTLSQREVLRVELREKQDVPPVSLNEEQKRVFDGLVSQMESPVPGKALLYGVTGSGKTAVYVKLIEKALSAGRSALLLVPEIALTPQLLGLLSAHFGSQVAVLHSSLPDGQRYDEWKRIRAGNANVVVGTRSAVFAPLKNPGIVILDEEQEHSYNSEVTPRYHARDIALWRGLRENALVLLGSATPTVSTMYYAKSGIYTLYTLKNRFNGKPLPKVEIVDMQSELEQGNDKSLSRPLQKALAATAGEGKQTILFLNRRGASRALVCVSCRQSPECPGCSSRLVYHSANDRLMCHYCGYSQRATQICPKCGGRLKTLGTGTQKVQEEMGELFPKISTLRMDTDTVSAVNTHEKLLGRFQKEQIPVLIGTQMVAKGLNLPEVTLVGVLDADMSLYSESYRGAENTFNMLTQVIGRAGRGDTPGNAMIQTFLPEHRVLSMAAKQDYDGFYDMEIALRRVQNVPPFSDITVITFVGEDEGAVLRGSVKFRDSLMGVLHTPDYREKNCTVLGPAPCVVPKINYRFRYRVTLRGKMDRPLRLLLAHLLRQFAADKETRGVSAFAETNGEND